MPEPTEPESEQRLPAVTESIHNRIVDQYYKTLEYCTLNFDNQSFYISGGALGISLAFIKDIVPLRDAIHIYAFYIALGLFILCLALGFLSHHKGMNFSLCELQKAHNQKYHEFKTDTAMTKLNIGIAASLILGLVALVGFCIVNIEHTRDRYASVDSETSQTIRINKQATDGSKIVIEGNVQSFQLIDTMDLKTRIEIK